MAPHPDAEALKGWGTRSWSLFAIGHHNTAGPEVTHETADASNIPARRTLAVAARARATTTVLGEALCDRARQLAKGDPFGIHPAPQVGARTHVVSYTESCVASFDQIGSEALEEGLEAAPRSNLGKCIP
jgi:hypothetical protein